MALLDADPNRTLSRWHARGAGLSRATLTSEPAEDRLVGAVAEPADAHDIVLVDCPGFGAQANLFAIGAADVVLVPAMTDEANLFEALRMRRIVDSASRLTRRGIPTRTLLTRVKRSGVAEHSHRQLAEPGADPLETRLADRAIYQEASFHGSSPVLLDPRGPAAREIRLLAKELEALAWWRAGAAAMPVGGGA